MPTYEYRCKECGEHLEVVQSFKDDALTECPACGASALRKVFGNIGITFKGSGFYRTDNRAGSRRGDSGSSSESAASSSKSDSASDSSSKSESTSTSESASKSDGSSSSSSSSSSPQSKTSASAS